VNHTQNAPAGGLGRHTSRGRTGYRGDTLRTPSIPRNGSESMGPRQPATLTDRQAYAIATRDLERAELINLMTSNQSLA